MLFYRESFHAVCYIGTMPRLVQIETWFFGIIHCIFYDYDVCINIMYVQSTYVCTTLFLILYRRRVVTLDKGKLRKGNYLPPVQY